MRRALTGITIALASACRITGVFECRLNDQCRSGDDLGTCQVSGFCSFADPSCPSGQRYADTAGDGFAGHCYGTIAPTDGAIDGPPFDPSTCPAVFAMMVASQPRSRYLITTSADRYPVQVATCAAHQPGVTHAAVIDSAVELAELVTLAGAGLRLFTGTVQDPTAVGVADGWIRFDGTALPATLWEPGQPMDADGVETDHAQQAGAIDLSTQGMHDVGGAGSMRMVCECDGQPVGAQASAFLADNLWP